MTIRWWTLVVVLVALLPGCDEESPHPESPPPGPLAFEGIDAPHSTARLVHIGAPFTFSEIVVVNSGTNDATLDSIDLVNATDEIDLVGALAAYVHGQPWIVRAGSPTFPPRFAPKLSLEADPLEGFTVPPSNTQPGRDGVQLIVGLMAQAGSAGVFQGVALNYHVGGQSFRVVFPYGLRACGPPTDFRGPGATECEAPPLLPA